VTKERAEVVPGALRLRDVKVGQHVAISLSLVMKQLEQAGYNREQLRREWA
jgi:hypothetical protein